MSNLEDCMANMSIVSNAEGTDFQILLNTPMSEGGHFQFKHEKSWNKERLRKPSQYAGVFALDANLISAQLSCLPLYDKIRLDSSLFSSEQINKMDSQTTKLRAKYDKDLPNMVKKTKADKSTTKKNTSQSKSVNISSAAPQLTNKLSVKEISTKEVLENSVLNDDEDLDELLGATTKSEKNASNITQTTPKANVHISPSTSATAVPPATDVDLDQWLDDYLES